MTRCKNAIIKSTGALLLTLKEYIKKKIELERIARLSVLLIKSNSHFANPLFKSIALRITREQKKDGGWVGVEDAIWNLSLLKEYDEFVENYYKGLKWLLSQKVEGGWGKNHRDIARIPLTGNLLYLIPEISGGENTLQWLTEEMKKEMKCSPILTYKTAFTLMALKKCGDKNSSTPFLLNMQKCLVSQQETDGGWGPWKKHPVGPSPYCTAVSLLGLLQYPSEIAKKSINKGAKWLLKHQLDNGLWPEHYIEEGSAWSLYALSKYYRYCLK